MEPLMSANEWDCLADDNGPGYFNYFISTHIRWCATLERQSSKLILGAKSEVDFGNMRYEVVWQPEVLGFPIQLPIHHISISPRFESHLLVGGSFSSGDYTSLYLQAPP